jgi:outer membrane protein assembly factor BamD (BamD/ComL family)
MDSALATLQRHARLFRDGELAEEREGLMVQALVGSHDYAQARERAERFHKRYPRSLFAPAVEQALRSIP